MNIITAPTVHLIGKQVVDDAELGRFLSDHDVGHWQTDTEIGGEKLVEVAGRVCYMSFAKPRPGGNKAYIDHILEVGHGSVLEHAVFSLLITGVSRSLTHEFVRHRHISPSQLSQRFVDESGCGFVAPPAILKDAHAMTLFRGAMADAMASYEVFAEYLETISTETDKTARRKQVREAARAVLPNATETKIFMTGNARAWRHFIEMRGSIHADAEIQRLAVAVLDKLRDAAPNLFGDYVVDESGISTEFRKV